jgi:hypothetical protein
MRIETLASNWDIKDQMQYMMALEAKKKTEGEDQQWENPLDPERPSDDRDKEQIARQYKEAKRRKDNLTEKDHIDKEPKDK